MILNRHKAIDLIVSKFYSKFGLGNVSLANIKENNEIIYQGTPGTVVKPIQVELRIFKHLSCIINISDEEDKDELEANIVEHIKYIDLTARNMLLDIDRYLLSEINRV